MPVSTNIHPFPASNRNPAQVRQDILAKLMETMERTGEIPEPPPPRAHIERGPDRRVSGSSDRGPDRRASSPESTVPQQISIVLTPGNQVQISQGSHALTIYIGAAPVSPGNAAPSPTVEPLIKPPRTRKKANLLTVADEKKGPICQTQINPNHSPITTVQNLPQISPCFYYSAPNRLSLKNSSFLNQFNNLQYLAGVFTCAKTIASPQ